MTKLEKDLEIIRRNAWDFEHMNQTPRLCLAVVKEDGFMLQLIKKQTPEICLAAVKENGYALEYVRVQTLDICLTAIKGNKRALRYVSDQTPELFDLMLENNIEIDETCIKIPIDRLSGKVRLYLKLREEI